MKSSRIERQHVAIVVVCLSLFAIGLPAWAQDSTVVAPETSVEDLAKKLQNPVAALISVPFQNNFDFGLGPSNDGFRYTLNIQPVIPISLNRDWNLISRTHSADHQPTQRGRRSDRSRWRISRSDSTRPTIGRREPRRTGRYNPKLLSVSG
jgi:hypothetical protein